jgi:protein disulfide-isomerase
LAAAVLHAASDAGEGEDAATKKALAAVRKAAPALLDAMLAGDEAIWATRASIVYGARQVIGWAFPEPSREAAAAEARWLAAAEAIGKDARASVDTRLMSSMPAVELALLRKKPDEKLPATLVEKARAAAKRADQDASTAYERHATIPNAGMLLAAAGDLEAARRLLAAELAKTKTPWYYESTLSYVYGEAGNSTEALAWSEKARKSAQGRASRLQWITSDLLLVARTPHAMQATKLAAVTKEYYDTALALSDGFAGRNARRSKSVAGALKDWLEEPAVKRVVEEAARSCRSETCAAHFAQLGAPSH